MKGRGLHLCEWWNTLLRRTCDNLRTAVGPVFHTGPLSLYIPITTHLQNETMCEQGIWDSADSSACAHWATVHRAKTMALSQM